MNAFDVLQPAGDNAAVHGHRAGFEGHLCQFAARGRLPNRAVAGSRVGK